MVDDDRRGFCRCSVGRETSVRRGGRTRSEASRHEAWYWGYVLTLLMGANEAKEPDRIGRDPELHSSAPQLEDSEVELEVCDAASEKTEEVEEEADEERDGAYG